jgi:hypothetical protein
VVLVELLPGHSTTAIVRRSVSKDGKPETRAAAPTAVKN